ncbi:LysR family transcriptional regulator [Roseivivax sp. CAU 1761]
MPYVESLRVFARVVELGSITAGGRDLRLTPAVASNRIKELEQRLGVRLFNRTTRSLTPTEVGRVFYEEAREVLDRLDRAEAVVATFSHTPRGAIRVAAPLGIGRRIVGPLVPDFAARYPETELRLRLTDRRVDILNDGLDVAFFLGNPSDSNLTLRKIADCDRVLVAAPAYLDARGRPGRPEDLMAHNCLLLRYPRSPEYYWVLQTPEGKRRLDVAGRFDADDGDMLTAWARAGHGIAMKPRFDVAADLASGRLVEVLPETPPEPALFGCLYPHRRLQDAKVALFLDYMAEHARAALDAPGAGPEDSAYGGDFSA